MPYFIRIKIPLIILFTISLSACGGGGGGGGDTPPAENNNNWDQMIWDTDNWN